MSIVIPAHNEERVIGRLLSGLLSEAAPDELEVIVVANGCTDTTVSVAESFGVRVIEAPQPGKWAAMRLGDEQARNFPRLYVDADIELGTGDVRALCAALDRPGVLAAVPTRVFPFDGCSWMVRWYYDVWTRLPDIRDGLWGRGVLAVGEEGNRRLRALPQVIGDDLVSALAFEPGESQVVPDSHVMIRPPRVLGDLLRRRVRTATGVAQVDQGGATPARPKTAMRALLVLVKAKPALAPKVAFFLGVAVVAKLRARRAIRTGDYSTWLRDESSRS